MGRLHLTPVVLVGMSDASGVRASAVWDASRPGLP